MKQTSIEWLKKELEDYGSPSHLNLDWKTFDEIFAQAKEMHKVEQEISDEEIEKAARDYDNSVIYGPPLLHFEQGAFWYREQLNQPKKD
jgi:hypothetical protein